jgi:hypothetical protein
MSTTIAARLDELRESLTETRGRLNAMKQELGTAIADGNEGRAGTLRRQVKDLDARCEELESAIPIAARRVEAEQEAAQAAEREAAAKLADELKGQQLDAARRVDAALSALQAAWLTYVDAFVQRSLALRRAGKEVANRQLNRHLEQAIYAGARRIADVIGLDRNMSPHARRLADLV